ncbi:hypothetical protein ISN45_Aa01g037870 [Arabidopsis thaliana x Arabidopsis arenosa]|uniref:Uncharacterized protein n=1 Tax=Arabidopsis thaliana x Arabidopsis arenosa TaxID=1240361 RepID=A0A8T2C7K1_9BRAS|nr:hypothetical protein ISN45_Aa01g037870 [Arabidopsis thaliana x Arabidopsis arenosa]
MEDEQQSTPNSGQTKPETSLSSDFEFGSLTPSSPSQDPFSENSPADHLFLNGRLLPHSFPTSTTTRSVSRTTSENTFRSNSSSSRSSYSSSPTSYTPRTSTCNIFKITSSSTGHGKETNVTCFGTRSEEIMCLRPATSLKKTNTCSSKEYYHKPSLILDLKKRPPMKNGKAVNKVSYLPQCKRKKATEIVTAQLYGSYSRRWQHITPVFKREGSVKSKGGGIKVGGRKKKTTRRKKPKKAEERRGMSKLMKWWKRILKAVVFACRECHAMEPQILVNDDADVKKKITNKCP